MKLNNFVKLFFKNFFVNKINIVMVIFFTLLSSIMFFCFSYYKGVKNVWNEWLSNSYDFDLAYILYDDDVILRNDLINNIKGNSHVLDVFLYDEFIGYVKMNEFYNSDISGDVSLIGTISGNKNILYGSDLDDNKVMEMICPSNFFPDSIYVNDSFDINSIIDLKDRIGEDIKMRYLDMYDLSMKLVGVFDSSYDYSEPNVCYVSHLTLKKLNNLYQSKLNVDSMPIYIQLDDISNIDIIKDYDGVMDVVQMKKIKTGVIDKVINVTSAVVIIIVVVMFFLSYISYLRKINIQYKQIGIMRIVGYENRIIKSLFYFESILVGIISSFIGYIISYFVLNKFVEIFLYSDPQLSIMNLSISCVSIFITVILTCFVLICSVIMALKRINFLDIRDVIYE